MASLTRLMQVKPQHFVFSVLNPVTNIWSTFLWKRSEAEGLDGSEYKGGRKAKPGGSAAHASRYAGVLSTMKLYFNLSSELIYQKIQVFVNIETKPGFCVTVCICVLSSSYPGSHPHQHLTSRSRICKYYYQDGLLFGQECRIFLCCVTISKPNRKTLLFAEAQYSARIVLLTVMTIVRKFLPSV